MGIRTLATVVAITVSGGCAATTSTDRSGEPSTSAPATSGAWAPTGELLYATLPTDTGDDFIVPVLHTINADGSSRRRLPISAMGAVWSRDGARMLVNGVSVEKGNIWPWRPAVADARGGHLKPFRLPGMADEVSNCRWTPDEKDVVCDVDGRVVRIDVATARTKVLTHGGADQVWGISADGHVLFAHQASGTDGIEEAEVWTIRIDGSGRRQLTEYGEVEGTYDNAGGSWLPDGSAIVVATPDGRLVKVDARTGDLIEIPLDENLVASRPAVSPDGTMIAFEALGNGQDIYVTPIDGGPVALVAGTDADELRPDWRSSA